MAIAYTLSEHATAFPSKLLAQNGGKHIYNVLLSTDADNGNIIARGDWKDFDRYEEAACTSFEAVIREQAADGNWYVEVTDPGDALLVYQVPMLINGLPKVVGEKNFYNKAGDTVRSYELAVGDIFEASEEAFNGTPEAGAVIEAVANKVMVISAEAGE